MKHWILGFICLVAILAFGGVACAEGTHILMVATQADSAALLVHATLDVDNQQLTLLHMSGEETLDDKTAALHYATSGASGLADALSTEWVQTDYTVILRLENAATIIDLLGGVPLMLNEEERVAYGLPAGNGVIDADGDTVIAFMQAALSGPADQRRRLLDAADALIHRLSVQSLETLLALIPQVLASIETNMPLNAMVSVVKDFVMLQSAPLVIEPMIS